MTTNISLDAMIAKADWESLTRTAGGKVMSEHTPGPWAYEKDAFNRVECKNQYGSIVGNYNNNYYIATIENAPQADANARLIAAAPEMLEALYDIASEPDEENEWDAVERYHAIREKARAAVAKATGAA